MIENQQIKGITFGTLKSLFISTIVICSTIIGIYYSLVTKIDKIAQSTESNNKLTELRLSYLEQKINALEIQINQIKLSTFLNLNIEDLAKGLIITILTSVLTIAYNTVSAGSLTFDWKSIGLAALTSGLAYLMKNLLTNSEGQFLGKEK